MKKPGKMIKEVLGAAGKKPATVQYPFERMEMPAKFRGRIRFLSDKCIGCKMCVRDCPSNCLTINKIGDKKFEAVLNMDMCIYCGQCVDSCPKDALEVPPEFELAQLDSSKFKIVLNEKAPSEPKKETKEEPAPDASEKKA